MVHVILGRDLIGLAGATYAPTGAITLFAQWTVGSYVVTFSPAGGVVSPTSATFVPGGTPITLPTPSFSGQAFDGWFTAASGGTMVGAAGASYTPSGPVTLFAQWHTAVIFTITFDPNGATGSIAPLSGAPGASVTVPGVAGLRRPGFTLLRWSTARNGTGTSFTCGAAMVLTATETLYAQWSGRPPAVALGAVGPFRSRTSALTAAHRRQIVALATRIKARHFKTVFVYGYVPNTGLVSLNVSISRTRASRVAAYLRSRLAALHVKVTVKSAGEGSLAGAASAVNRRVEVFAQ